MKSLPMQFVFWFHNVFMAELTLNHRNDRFSMQIYSNGRRVNGPNAIIRTINSKIQCQTVFWASIIRLALDHGRFILLLFADRNAVFLESKLRLCHILWIKFRVCIWTIYKDISRMCCLEVDLDPTFIVFHPQNRYYKHRLVPIGSVRWTVNNED